MLKSFSTSWTKARKKRAKASLLANPQARTIRKAALFWTIGVVTGRRGSKSKNDEGEVKTRCKPESEGSTICILGIEMQGSYIIFRKEQFHCLVGSTASMLPCRSG